MSHGLDHLNQSARAAVDRDLAAAANALERAAREIEDLLGRDIKYEIAGSGDVLTYVRTLSRSVLELQNDVRKANHEA